MDTSHVIAQIMIFVIMWNRARCGYRLIGLIATQIYNDLIATI